MRLNLYVSVGEHDREVREGLLRELHDLDIQPVFHGDKIEIRYYGERETILELAAIVEGIQAHSVNVWTGK